MAKIAAFFDVDGTLIRGASTWYLARDLYSRGYFGLDFFVFAAHQALLYVIFGENIHRVEQVKKRSLQIIEGKLESDLVLVGEELYDRFLQERLFPGALDIIQKHLDAGHDVWLVSATPREIAQSMAHRLGLTGALGTVVEVDEWGRYTGKMAQSLMHGTMKAKAVLELSWEHDYDLKQCYAYSDSMSDEKLLNLVGHPRVVNPEPKLRRIAKRRHWPVYDFAHRRLDIAIKVRSRYLPAIMVGFLWTVRVLWRYVIRRILRTLGRVWHFLFPRHH